MPKIVNSPLPLARAGFTRKFGFHLHFGKPTLSLSKRSTTFRQLAQRGFCGRLPAV